MQKEENRHQLTTSQIEDLRLAASKMKGASRRSDIIDIALALLVEVLSLGYISNNRASLIRSQQELGL